MSRPLLDLGIAHTGDRCLHLACSCHVEWVGKTWRRIAGVHCDDHNPASGRRSVIALDDQPLRRPA